MSNSNFQLAVEFSQRQTIAKGKSTKRSKSLGFAVKSTVMQTVLNDAFSNRKLRRLLTVQVLKYLDTKTSLISRNCQFHLRVTLAKYNDDLEPISKSFVLFDTTNFLKRGICYASGRPTLPKGLTKAKVAKRTKGAKARRLQFVKQLDNLVDIVLPKVASEVKGSK